ncbi:MAG: hypothetical protein J5654_01900 [Victivallales bacterium]|nr:hypothetical protein [Victivallales bacterium]
MPLTCHRDFPSSDVRRLPSRRPLRVRRLHLPVGFAMQSFCELESASPPARHGTWRARSSGKAAPESSLSRQPPDWTTGRTAGPTGTGYKDEPSFSRVSRVSRETPSDSNAVGNHDGKLTE